jgi:hypothetical protein
MIYTVDSNNSQTQCILVDNGYILTTGTLGASSELLSTPCTYSVFYSGRSVLLA